MIRILHTADWQLDAPLRDFTTEQQQELRNAMLALPGQIADISIREDCDLCLIAGDVFHGAYTRESYEAVFHALERMEIPVFIAPGEQDPYREGSIWTTEPWPDNVYIFRSRELSSYRVPELDCRIYGAAFTDVHSPALLEDFFAECDERHALLVLHGDPADPNSSCNPVTAAQIREAGVDYAALGHLHVQGRFDAGAGLCAWPGCAMGLGFQETGAKGVLIAQVGKTVNARFVPLNAPRFLEFQVEAGNDPTSAVEALLPPLGSRDHLRIHLTGEAATGTAAQLRIRFAAYPNLTILDETVPLRDLWDLAGEDSLSGLFFQILRETAVVSEPQTARTAELAARISRRILDGQEVVLP